MINSCIINAKTFQSGWYEWPPFQYNKIIYDQPFVHGLDVELGDVIFGMSGDAIATREISWFDHQQKLRTGELDIAFGSFKTPERLEFAYFSEPYRSEINVIYFRKDTKPSKKMTSGQSVITYIKKNNLKLGVISGYSYASNEINQFIADPNNSHHIVYHDNDKKNLYSLALGEVDLLLIDQISGAFLKERLNLNSEIYEYAHYKEEGLIYAMFSKQSTSLEDVKRFNHGLHLSKKTGEYDKVLRKYLIPVLLNNFVHKDWFFLLEIFGTISFAISGIILAKKEEYNIFGAFVLAALPSLGGGIIRDICVDRNPISVLRSPVYVAIVLISVIVCFFVYRLILRLSRYLKKEFLFNKKFVNGLLETCDAIGIATFTLTGAGIAMEYRLEPNFIWIPLIACLTGAGGGILRDVVRSEKNIATFKISYYAQITLVWGLFFVIAMENSLPEHLPFFIALTMLGVFFTRIAVVFFNIKSIKL